MKNVHRQKSVPRNTNCIPRFYKFAKRPHQCKGLRQQICKVDAMGIDGKNMLLSRPKAGQALGRSSSYELTKKKSVPIAIGIIVVYINEPIVMIGGLTGK